MNLLQVCARKSVCYSFVGFVTIGPHLIQLSFEMRKCCPVRMEEERLPLWHVLIFPVAAETLTAGFDLLKLKQA